MSVIDVCKFYINWAFELMLTPVYIDGMEFNYGSFFILFVALVIAFKVISFWAFGGGE